MPVLEIDDAQQAGVSAIVAIYLHAVTFQKISMDNFQRLIMLKLSADDSELSLVHALKRKIESNQIRLTAS